MNTISSPIIIAGDFNTVDRQPNYELLNHQLHDSFREAGWGFGLTYPATGTWHGVPLFPIVRLDYIWHDDHWKTERAWTGTDASADHRYVIADLYFQP